MEILERTGVVPSRLASPQSAIELNASSVSHLGHFHVIRGKFECHFSSLPSEYHASLCDTPPSRVWIALAFPAKVVSNVCGIDNVEPRRAVKEKSSVSGRALEMP